MTRFTETEKWRDPWFRRLSAGQKLIFQYILDNCNNAGFLEWDVEMVAFYTGVEQAKLEGALKGLERGIKGPFDGWIWAKNFLKHQRNWPLNKLNPSHRQIISLIEAQFQRFSLCQEFEEMKGAMKGLVSPLGTSTGKGKGTSKGNSDGKAGKMSLAQIEDFGRFWSAYPKKRSKPDAEKAWLQMNPDIELCLEAIELARRSEEWKADKGKWIPYPASWLNQKRWLDEHHVNDRKRTKEHDPDYVAAKRRFPDLNDVEWMNGSDRLEKFWEEQHENERNGQH